MLGVLEVMERNQSKKSPQRTFLYLLYNQFLKFIPFSWYVMGASVGNPTLFYRHEWEGSKQLHSSIDLYEPVEPVEAVQSAAVRAWSTIDEAELEQDEAPHSNAMTWCGLPSPAHEQQMSKMSIFKSTQ